MINLASVSGKRPLVRRTPYCASKMAVIGLTSTLAFEVGPSGVNVNSLSPGPVDGPRMDRNFRLEAERSGRTYDEAVDTFVSRAALGRMVTETEVGPAVAGHARDARTLWRRHRPVGGNGGVMSLRSRAHGRREAARRAAADAGRGAGRDGRGQRLRLHPDRLRARTGRPDPPPAAHRRGPAARRRRAGADRCARAGAGPPGPRSGCHRHRGARTWTTPTPRASSVDSVHYPPLGQPRLRHLLPRRPLRSRRCRHPPRSLR